ncbi:MAG: hypothetical protein ACLQBJ_09610 [Bryobacteraceae bacterium]
MADEISHSAGCCTGALGEQVQERVDGGDQHTLLSLEAYYEFLYFFLHVANRMAFQQHGRDASARLPRKLVPLVAQKARLALNGDDSPFDWNRGIDATFVETHNKAELDYARCREVIVDEGVDVSSLERIAAGTKRRDGGKVFSRGLVNQLAFNVQDALSRPVDAILRLTITSTVIGVLRRESIEKLVREAMQEIKREQGELH